MSRYAYNKQTKQSTLIAGGQPPITIAGTESTSTASKAYTVGQYLVFNSFLCRVISAIAQGDTLVIDTNISITTVGDEISNHLTVNGTGFFFDVKNGEYGYNTSELRGADTFHPFKRTSNYQLTITIQVQLRYYSGAVLVTDYNTYVYNIIDGKLQLVSGGARNSPGWDCQTGTYIYYTIYSINITTI